MNKLDIGGTNTRYIKYLIYSLPLAVMAFFWFSGLCFTMTENSATPQESLCSKKWAVPIEREGLPNLYKVTNNLYRGAQPTAKGMSELRKMGIKTIVNLRSFHSDRKKIKGKGLNYEHIYMKAWHPEEKELIRFLQIVTNKDLTPVFIHCQQGADRTGTMCAIYRIIICGWSKDKAIQEMKEGDFGYHKIWSNLIRFLKKLDVEKIRKELEKED